MVSATKVLLSVAVVGGGGGMLIYSSLAEADYYKHVSEVTLEPARWTDKSLKVHGLVEPGSIEEKIEGQTTVRHFVLQWQGERIRVRHTGPKPDTFRDLSEVVAKGTLHSKSEGLVLEASELMAKCPSKYTEKKQVGAVGVKPASGAAGSAKAEPAPAQSAPASR